MAQKTGDRGFFGSGARAALPVYGAAFSPSFKELDQFVKLVTSSMTKIQLYAIGISTPLESNKSLHLIT
jgi:hypothetical protein